jgi:hypothetical protein
MNNWCICWFFTHILVGILIFKGLTARRLYKSFGIKGLINILEKYLTCIRKGRLLSAHSTLFPGKGPEFSVIQGSFLHFYSVSITASVRSLSPGYVRTTFSLRHTRHFEMFTSSRDTSCKQAPDMRCANLLSFIGEEQLSEHIYWLSHDS